MVILIYINNGKHEFAYFMETSESSLVERLRQTEHDRKVLGSCLARVENVFSVFSLDVMINEPKAMSCP